jgi:site-specific recombinase XerD
MHNAHILLQQFCDHSKFIRGYSPYTIARYRQTIGFYLRSNQIENISDITEQNLRNFFLKGRVERDWSANTCIVYHKSFTVFFRWCNDNGYLDAGESLVANIELPKLEKPYSSFFKSKLQDIQYNRTKDHPDWRFAVD